MVSRTCDKLISDHLAITGETCNGMKECISLRRPGLFFKFRGCEDEGTVDKGVHELVDDLNSSTESTERYKLLKRPQASDQTLNPLNFGKCFGKLRVRVIKTVDTASEEEFRGSIQSIP